MISIIHPRDVFAYAVRAGADECRGCGQTGNMNRAMPILNPKKTGEIISRLVRPKPLPPQGAAQNGFQRRLMLRIIGFGQFALKPLGFESKEFLFQGGE